MPTGDWKENADLVHVHKNTVKGWTDDEYRQAARDSLSEDENTMTVDMDACVCRIAGENAAWVTADVYVQEPEAKTELNSYAVVFQDGKCVIVKARCLLGACTAESISPAREPEREIVSIQRMQ